MRAKGFKYGARIVDIWKGLWAPQFGSGHAQSINAFERMVELLEQRDIDLESYINSQFNLLAYTFFSAPGFYTTASTTFADVNAAGAVITFSAPPSGAVLVRTIANARLDSSNTTINQQGGYIWNLREGTTNLTDSDVLVNFGVFTAGTGAAPVTAPLICAECVVSELIPGTEYTWKMGHRVDSTQVAGSTGAISGGASDAIRMSVYRYNG